MLLDRELTGDWYPWLGGYPYMAPSQGIPAETTFPGEPLRTKVMIALNPDFTQSHLTWNWADITHTEAGETIVRWEQQVDIIYGGRPNSATVDASTCKFRATNDKRFSRRNPLSPYYGQLSEYTPVWIQLDYGEGFKDKYHGYIHDFSKAWDRSGNDPYVDLTARGPLYKLGKSVTPVSPMLRANIKTTHAYWALEDGSDSGQLSWSLPTIGEALERGTFAGEQTTVDIAEDSTMRGSKPVIKIVNPNNFGGVVGKIPAYTDTGVWAVSAPIKVHTGALDPELVVFYVRTGSAVHPVIEVYIDTFLSTIEIRARGPAGGVDDSASAAIDSAAILSDWAMISIVSEDHTGGGLDSLTATAYNSNGDLLGSVTDVFSSGTHSMPTEVTAIQFHLSPASGGGASLGHLSMRTAFEIGTDDVALARAMHGWETEMAHTRMARVSAEEGLTFSTDTTESGECGPQAIAKPLDVLRDAELVGGGTIYEKEFGLAYKAFESFTNQDVLLTLDATLSQILDLGSPVDNDLDFVNQWTVSRPSGASATVQGRDGVAGVTLGVNELVYPNSKEVKVFSDDQLLDIAGWLAHETTIDEDRWPAISFSLAAHPELISSWVSFPFGGRLQALNVYEEVGDTTLDQIHRGHREHWNSRRWEAILNCSPSAVYDVLGVGNDNSRADSDSSSLLADITSDQTSFDVYTSDINELWTEDPGQEGELPLDIGLHSGPGDAISSGGETIKISAVSSVVLDRFDRIEVDRWGSPNIGPAWTRSAGNDSDYSVDGSDGLMLVSTAAVGRVMSTDTGSKNGQAIVSFIVPAVATGASFFTYLFLRSANTQNGYYARIEWATSGNATLRMARFVNNGSNFLGSGVSLGAYSALQVWTLRFDLQGTQLRSRAWVTIDEPQYWFETVEDSVITEGTNAQLRVFVNSGNTNVPFTQAFDNFEVINPQKFTVQQRALNGIVKAHKANTIVRVEPMTVVSY